MAITPKDILPIIAGPQPTDEARQPYNKPKADCDTKTQIEEKFEGVKFYELDDKEEILPTGIEPVPEITMPSFKKRVHSQRIPQHERAAVTPYEGAYDEKYSSDEENIEYDVCEPEDLTERSNSTVTFSEDVYDSDAVEEMIRNQMRETSKISQSEDAKSVLKEGKDRGSKKDDKQPTHPQSKITVSPSEKITEGTIVGKLEMATSGINKKDGKGEEIFENVTKSLQEKETAVKGEKETVTKFLQSTIPLQIDQITDSSATNKHDFAESDQTKPLQDTALKHSGILTETTQKPFREITKITVEKSGLVQESQKTLGDFFAEKIVKAEKTEVPTTEVEEPPKTHLTDAAVTTDLPDKLPGQDTISKLVAGTLGQKDSEITEKVTKPKDDRTPVESLEVKSLPQEGTVKETMSPTREEAAKTANKLIEDIAEALQDVFPKISSKAITVKPEDSLTNPTDTSFLGKVVDRKLTNMGSALNDFKVHIGDMKQLESVIFTDSEKATEPEKSCIFSEIKDVNAQSKPDTTKDAILRFSITQKQNVEADSLPSETKTQKLSANVEVHKEVHSTEESIEKPSTAVQDIKKMVNKVSDSVIKLKTYKDEKPAAAEINNSFTVGSIVSNGIANGVVKVTAKGKERGTGVTEKPRSVAADVMSKVETILSTEESTVQSDKIFVESAILGTESKTADILVLEDSNKSSKKEEKGQQPCSDLTAIASSVVSTILSTTSESEQWAEEVTKAPAVQSECTDLTAEEEESKPRVIFRIDSEDDLHSDTDSEMLPLPSPTSPIREFTEEVKRELKESLEKDQIKIEERLTKVRIFDISNESLSKTKELVDERLRKISEIKPPSEVEEQVKKDKSSAPIEEIKIGRFHITPAFVEEVVSKSKEHEIVERLKTTRTDSELHEEIEKELPEKLTEADLEEVIRELKKEGLKTDVYLQPEDPEKEEKKEKTLKRVERRFERMASETLEKDLEEGVSEEKLNEKREIEFQRMVSNLSSEEVAEYQQEYLQLLEEGGLSSLTPTDDWESRDPDTPENELDDDTTRKSESFQGSPGIGETGEPTKTTKKNLKSPMSPPKPLRFSADISPKAQPLTPIDPSHVGSSPSEIEQSSGFVSERSDDIPTYGERKKFWEQMSSSQSSETASELPRSMVGSVSSIESAEIEKSPKSIEEPEKISVKAIKQKFEKETTETRKTPEDISSVKSLAESYSKKIAAGELIMPAIPRPKSSASKESFVHEIEETEISKIPDSTDTAIVSELEVKLKSRGSGAPITETVISGSTKIESKPTKMKRDASSEKSTDSETEFISKYGVESVAFDNTTFTDDHVTVPRSEQTKLLEESFHSQPLPVIPIRKTVHERSMSLPVAELPVGVKLKKKDVDDEMKKEVVIEQIMSHKIITEEEKIVQELTPEIEEAASNAMDELLSKGVKIAEETLRSKEKTIVEETELCESLHQEKSEIESNEKQKISRKLKQMEDSVPFITITGTGRRQPETGSIGESEDTQSESDITPEDARVVDNGDAHWNGSGTQSGGFSPKDDIDYPKEIGETGIGRWIGQEDLSKQVWEKDELDSFHFKIQTKWERTRSEGASPKEPFICTPEEHYPDTVWEVPVQEQLEKEEITHDIPLEKQVIIEKDEEEYEEEEEKIKLTEEEAKEIAEEILEYIQFEVENRSSFLVNDDETLQGITQAQVTDYLRHLTGGKEFDDQDVQLIESILVKKQKGQFWKSQSQGTAGCSADITDEELRSTGLDNDSPVENQIMKMQSLEEEDCYKTEIPKDDILKKTTDDNAQRLKDVEIVDQTIAEVKESLEAAQEQLIEQHKKKMKSEILKKESPSEFEFKGMSYDRKITEAVTEQSSDWETVKDHETIAEEGRPVTEVKNAQGGEKFYDKEFTQTTETKSITGDEKIEQTVGESLEEQAIVKLHEEEVIQAESEQGKMVKLLSKDLSDKEKKLEEPQQIKMKTETTDVIQTDNKSIEKTEFDKSTKKTEELMEKIDVNGKQNEILNIQAEDKETQQTKESQVLEKQATVRKLGEKTQKSLEEKKEEYRDSLRESGKTERKTIDATGTSKNAKTEILITDSKIQKAVLLETKPENEEIKHLEISVPESFVIRKIGDQLYSSEDSPRSASLEESMKSPPSGDEVLSSASSVDKQVLKTEKPDVVFRHSTSGFLKTDRRSDLEPYSSSGESHYHSFEQTSSRPCSSDVEGLLAGNVGTAGSSEYESAISREISSKHPTSTDYQTAVSSLSSRESIKSLDSESSGHLASVEVSSEASETLIPSALELDRDIEAPIGMLLDDGLEEQRQQPPVYRTQISAPATIARVADEDFEIISESEVASWAGGVSEDEEGVLVTGEEALNSEEHAQKMKRSHEMTFQPEPKPIVFSDSLDGFSKYGALEKMPLGSTDENSSIISVPDDRFGSSLEETGSVLSMSLSTTSDPSAMRTVIELSHTDSDKMDGSLTVSATSLDSASREDLDTIQQQVLTSEMSTSTTTSGLKKKAESVTITTSSSDVQGVPCVSTQVTSVSRKSSMADEAKSESESHDLKPVDFPHANGPTQVEYVADYDEVETTKTKKPQGHRRKESTSNFVPTMMWNLSEARTQKVRADIIEAEEEYGCNKYVYDVTLTEKEVKNDEKKEADDSESYEQSFEGHERKISEGEEVEEFKDYDNNRPQSQISRTDSDSGRRPVSSVFSEDQPDSELSELMKQGSSETEKEDPLERPLSPEPEDMENKDITPEFSSEAQASVTELEMEYSGAFSRRDEYASHVSPIREEKSDARFKESSEEYTGVETAPEGLRSQTSLESTIAEKHELETGEKEILQKKSEERTINDVPDITVTEHTTPVSHQKFQYPETKEEEKERKSSSKTPDTPASISSRTSSSSTDQGKEYNLDEAEIKKFPIESLRKEKEVSETKEEMDSPSSDSFEMLDKPDITEEFVIIEEVGREAQENDQEGRSIQITSGKKKPPKRVKEEDVKMSPPSPVTKMTDLKYYPAEEDPDLFPLDTESPPQPTTRKFVEKLKRKSSKEEKDELDYEQQIEQNKKWLETQFQGEQAAKIMSAYGYEMDFDRAPLEDIKEEDLNELDTSSKIGSMGSQKESLGSFGSVKDSFSSTPDYDVLAGRKYFTRSGDHDDVSMSSLQEFELIEKKLLENGKKSGSSSSQDSLSSKKLGTSSKSGQDDVSSGSLKEFETLENACTTVVNMEKKAKQEEAILSEIDEGHESQISESESCETVSAVMREKIEYDTEDFDKMFEIDEIIRQAQSNVEKFSEMQALEKIESIGRGDSYEEVAKVPDLELDMPLSEKSKQGKSYNPLYSTQVVTKKKVEEWRAAEKTEKQKSAGNLVKSKDLMTQSELLENGGKIKSISADSLEIQTADKQIILEGKEDTISLDSYRSKSQKSNGYNFPEMTHKSDSMEEVSRHHESSSGNYTSSRADDSHQPPPKPDFMLGSIDSLDPTSSTATHATYQYETDSVMSSSFTSGDSNTMVSGADNLNPPVSGQSATDPTRNPGVSRTNNRLENPKTAGGKPLKKKNQRKANIRQIFFQGCGAEEALEEYLTGLPKQEDVETEELDESGKVHIKKVLQQVVVFKSDKNVNQQERHLCLSKIQKHEVESQAIHGRVLPPPDVQKITFKGSDAVKQLREFMQQQEESEEEEVEEDDEDGNVHVKKVIKQRVFVRPEARSINSSRILSNDEVQQYLESLEEAEDYSKETASEGSKTSKVVLPSGVETVTFSGPVAKKLLQELMQLQQQAKAEEVEDDECDNVHIKREIKQRVFVRPEATSSKSGRILSNEEVQEYLESLEEPQDYSKETAPEGSKTSKVVLPSRVEKVTFRGPDAEKRLQEFMQQQEQPEVEEIKEEDEYGNVHVKKVIKQRVFVRPEARSSKSGRILSNEEVQQYLESLEEPQDYSKETVSGKKPQTFQELEEADCAKILHQKIVLERQKLTDRLLTEEEFQERLKQQHSRPTTVHSENVYIGNTEPFVSEIIEPLDEEGFSHIIHRKVQMAPEVQKVVFRGPKADQALKAYVEASNSGENYEEMEEVDSDGNVHVKRILKRKIVLKPEDLEKTGLTGEELRSYLQQFEFEHFEGDKGPHVQTLIPHNSTNQVLTEGFSSSVVLTDKEGHAEERKLEPESSSAIKKECGIPQRPPLVSDVSMDDEAEYDTTEHDWRHQLEILHAEADEEEIEQNLDAALAASYPSKKK